MRSMKNYDLWRFSEPNNVSQWDQGRASIHARYLAKLHALGGIYT